MFTSHTSSFYAHHTHVISPLKTPDNVLIQEVSTTIIEQNNDREQRLCQPTEMPKFLRSVLYPKVSLLYYIGPLHHQLFIEEVYKYLQYYVK